jgi:hypothetical protein
MENKKTNVSRSWGRTIGYLIGALVLLGISVVLFMSIVEGPMTIGIALLPAIVGVILFFMAFGGAGAAACPVCGASLTALSTKSNDGVLCTSCHHYLEGNDGLLWTTDESRVAEDAIFSSPLPQPFTFPQGCCVCGGVEVGREKISLQNQNASSVITAQVGVTSYTTVSVEVPYCAAHKGGARLSGTPQYPHIKFRSYPYLRAFCQINSTIPG